MQHAKNKDRFSRAASIAVLMLIFGLLVSTVIFVTFYAVGIQFPSVGYSKPLALNSVYCNSTGTFVALRNNLDTNISIAYVSINNHNSTILLYDTPYITVQPGAEHLFGSSSYVCPGFDSLNDIGVYVAFESSVEMAYSSNTGYLLTTNINVNKTSSTVT